MSQIGLVPDAVMPAQIDEAPQPDETPRRLAVRRARAKAQAVASQHGHDYVLAADTVVALGRRILPKVETEDEGRACLELLSGRAHRVLTAVAVSAPDGRLSHRLVETRLHFKRLTATEVTGYLASCEGVGKAGGYAIQGRAGAFVVSLEGSYTAVVGLPLYEAMSLLNGLGYRSG